jgi:hypothetical protein
VLIDWTREFDRWLTRVEDLGGSALEWTLALLDQLEGLDRAPADETATLKRVRQARRHELWRLAHPFVPEVAIRLIVWFPDDQRAVIALMGFDKARLGDVWYAGAAVRCEAMIDQWLREQQGGHDEG